MHTRLSHAGRAGTHVHGFVNPPVHRGSTVLYPTMADRRGAGAHRLRAELIYGVMGTPTHWPLENVIAEIEGGTHCQIVVVRPGRRHHAAAGLSESRATIC